MEAKVHPLCVAKAYYLAKAIEIGLQRAENVYRHPDMVTFIKMSVEDARDNLDALLKLGCIPEPAERDLQVALERLKQAATSRDPAVLRRALEIANSLLNSALYKMEVEVTRQWG